jgi:hypothetical protein
MIEAGDGDTNSLLTNAHRFLSRDEGRLEWAKEEETKIALEIEVNNGSG